MILFKKCIKSISLHLCFLQNCHSLPSNNLSALCNKVILEFDSKKIMISSMELVRLCLSNDQVNLSNHLFLFDMVARKLRVPFDSIY